MQWCQWGSNRQPLNLDTITLPLSNCPLSYNRWCHIYVCSKIYEILFHCCNVSISCHTNKRCHNVAIPRQKTSCREPQWFSFKRVRLRGMEGLLVQDSPPVESLRCALSKTLCPQLSTYSNKGKQEIIQTWLTNCWQGCKASTQKKKRSCHVYYWNVYKQETWSFMKSENLESKNEINSMH